MIQLLILFSLQLTAGSDSWPDFLGQGAGPIDAATVPLEWSPDGGIAWTQPIEGYGQSSPVIAGQRVFVTSVAGAEKETLHLICYDLKTGQPEWTYTQPSSFPEKSSVYISRAAPTPCIDESTIYAYFESGDVVAASLEGEKRWAISLTKDFGPPDNNFGLAASPVQTDDHIFILIDNAGPSYLVAIEKQSGKVAWKTDRTSRRSWSSPALMTIGGTEQIVCSSDGSVDGYDPATGQLLWSWGEIGGNTGTTPLPAGDSRFLIAGSPGRNGENTELSRKSNGVLSVTKIGDVWTPKVEWTDPAPAPSFSSPRVHQGLAYWINRAGVVYCLDAQTGASKYTQRLPETAWATPVGVGDRVYVFGRNGNTMVLASGDEFELLAENKLWTEGNEPVNNTPTAEETSEERRRAAGQFSRPTVYGAAVVDGAIVIRTGSQLFCVGQK